MITVETITTTNEKNKYNHLILNLKNLKINDTKIYKRGEYMTNDERQK
jgi:hypothetical protein